MLEFEYRCIGGAGICIWLHPNISIWYNENTWASVCQSCSEDGHYFFIHIKDEQLCFKCFFSEKKYQLLLYI